MGTTSRDVTINHGVPQCSPLSPILYLIFTHDLPPTSKVFRSIFADDLKYFIAGPNLSIITTKLQQSMDGLAVYANQWRIGLRAGKTSKILFQRSSLHPLIGTSHYTTGPSALSPPPSFLASLSTPRHPSPNISMLSPTLLVTAFSNSYLYLPPPMGHHHPPPSDCLTPTSVIYYSTVARRLA